MNLERGRVIRDKEDKVLWKITADYREVDTKLDFEIKNLNHEHYNTVTEYEIINNIETGKWQLVNLNG